MSLIKKIFGIKTEENEPVAITESGRQLLEISEGVEKIRLSIRLSADRDSRSKGSEAWLIDVRNGSRESIVEWQDFPVTPPLFLKNLGTSAKPAPKTRKKLKSLKTPPGPPSRWPNKFFPSHAPKATWKTSR